MNDARGGMIEVDGLTKHYGALRAVDGISFAVPHGQIVGFLGPNGAGKTTTMRMLASFIPPTGGRASIDGHDVVEDSLNSRRKLGYMPESVPMYGDMRVEEYLGFRAKLKGVERSQRQSRVDFALERCALTDRRRQLIGTLSKGYRQRVGLADSLVHNPPLLVLDEPTIGLDPIQIGQVRNLIRELSADHTILISTHILYEVEMLCERVMIVNRGKLVVDTSLAEFQSDQRVVVEVRATEVAVQSALGAGVGFAGVRAVAVTATSAPFVQIEFRLEKGADPREAIFSWVLGRGWALRRLSLEQASLELAFIDVVRQASEGEAVSAT